MQERYLGDSHDFIKYALLQHLSQEIDVEIGVNWYLTEPSKVDGINNNDGEKRHHLTNKEWRGWRPSLLENLLAFQAPEDRRIENVPASNVLPAGTCYFVEPVPSRDRLSWHSRAMSALASAELIFLDPDNGFQVDSMSTTSSPKYALYKEAADFFNLNKIVVSIQFARQCDPIERGRSVRARLLAHVPSAIPMPIVRGRVAPNILFFTLSPPSMAPLVEEALRSFGGHSKLELID